MYKIRKALVASIFICSFFVNAQQSSKDTLKPIATSEKRVYEKFPIKDKVLPEKTDLDEKVKQTPNDTNKSAKKAEVSSSNETIEGKNENDEEQSWFKKLFNKVIGIIWFSIKLFFIAIAIYLIFLLVKYLIGERKKYLLLVAENEQFRTKIIALNKEIKNLNKRIPENLNYKAERSAEEIEIIKKNKVEEIFLMNKLNVDELNTVSKNNNKRWLTIGYSSIGKTHVESVPQIPCQDNCYYEELRNGWQLAIVCDGAGSAKMSHFGSEVISKGAIPNNIKSEMENLHWYNKGIFPTDKEWRNIITKVLQKSYTDLQIWVGSQETETSGKQNIRDFATTVIVILYNANGALVANIGDGRGGFLNIYGEFKALFTPYKGNESNETIFITSPIWTDEETYIQTKVIEEDLLSIFILSDGMEKATFECSNLTDEIFIDANIPYKNFFYPVINKIKKLNQDGENKLFEDWKEFLASGNEAIKNESDDKTLLISVLK